MTPRRSCPRPAPSLGPGLRIHQTWQSTICAPSLLGQCPGPCPLHHAPYPYHWQLLRRRAGRWESVPDLAQDQLERLYCAGAPSAQLGRSNADPCVLDLNGCRVESLDFERWRRLTTSSSPQDSPHFYTQWITYRGSEGCWCPYQEPLASEIEASYLRGEKRFHFAMEDCTYVINWVSLSESNLTRAGYRKICRRPRYRSLLEMVPYLRTLSPMDRPREPIHHRPGPVAGTVSAAALPVELPPSWARAPDPSLVPLSVSDAEYQMVYWTFHQTLAESRFIVVRISRVQNAALWQKYIKRRSDLQEELGDSFPPGSWDRHLFHGTSEPCARSICLSNFDPGLAGRHGARYGRGACFAAAASYSHSFASPSAPPAALRRMFLAKVLTGRSALGRPHLAAPPLLGPGLPGARYDSCVDSLEEPAIFVVFDSAQCYPYWLIEYQAVTTILLD